ncbi:unnamed protein product [Rhodiola kirilowii]
MKFKINKACDLSSISVLPPQIRRPNIAASGQQQMSHIRSQQSQQSLSQSQHGFMSQFSQFSQNSLDDTVTNDQSHSQRYSSQDKENSGQRFSCMGTMSYQREESQKPISRPSTDALRKWNSSSASDNRPVSEALEQRIGRMENSVTRLGIILDSMQSDVLQVNKGTKEVSQELEGIKQKLNVIDNSLQQLNKGQQDNKASLDERLKEICDQLSKDACQAKLQEILLKVSVMPELIEKGMVRLQNLTVDTFTKELQALGCNLRTQNENSPQPSLPALTATAATCLEKVDKKKVPLKLEWVPKGVSPSSSGPEIQISGWKSVKRDRGTIAYNDSNKMHRQNGVSVIEQEREWKITIDSDEEIDGGFSCLLKEKGTSVTDEDDCMLDIKVETERILRSARRRKRRMSKTIIIN